MKNKKTLYSVLVIAIIFYIAWYLFHLTKVPNVPVGKSPTDKKEIPVQPTIPKFVFGTVDKIEDKKITLKVGEENKIVNVDDKTVITKQVKESSGYVSSPVVFSEIKIGMQMVVYYRSNAGFKYEADKIQILNL